MDLNQKTKEVNNLETKFSDKLKWVFRLYIEKLSHSYWKCKVSHKKWSCLFS